MDHLPCYHCRIGHKPQYNLGKRTLTYKFQENKLGIYCFICYDEAQTFFNFAGFY